MAFPGIGGFDFITLKGGINPGTGEQLEEITRPGVDGVAYRLMGRRGRSFPMYSMVDVITETNARDLIYDYKDIVAEIVNIRDGPGALWENAIVIGVFHQRTLPMETPVGGVEGGNGKFLVWAAWELQMTDTI